MNHSPKYRKYLITIRALVSRLWIPGVPRTREPINGTMGRPVCPPRVLHHFCEDRSSPRRNSYLPVVVWVVVYMYWAWNLRRCGHDEQERSEYQRTHHPSPFSSTIVLP